MPPHCLDAISDLDSLSQDLLQLVFNFRAFIYLSFFGERVSLQRSGTHVDQAGLEITEVHLPLRSLFNSLGTLLFGAVWVL